MADDALVTDLLNATLAYRFAREHIKSQYAEDATTRREELIRLAENDPRRQLLAQLHGLSQDLSVEQVAQIDKDPKGLYAAISKMQTTPAPESSVRAGLRHTFAFVGTVANDLSFDVGAKSQALIQGTLQGHPLDNFHKNLDQVHSELALNNPYPKLAAGVGLVIGIKTMPTKIFSAPVSRFVSSIAKKLPNGVQAVSTKVSKFLSEDYKMAEHFPAKVGNTLAYVGRQGVRNAAIGAGFGAVSSDLTAEGVAKGLVSGGVVGGTLGTALGPFAGVRAARKGPPSATSSYSKKGTVSEDNFPRLFQLILEKNGGDVQGAKELIEYMKTLPPGTNPMSVPPIISNGRAAMKSAGLAGHDTISEAAIASADKLQRNLDYSGAYGSATPMQAIDAQARKTADAIDTEVNRGKGLLNGKDMATMFSSAVGDISSHLKKTYHALVDAPMKNISSNTGSQARETTIFEVLDSLSKDLGNKGSSSSTSGQIQDLKNFLGHLVGGGEVIEGKVTKTRHEEYGKTEIPPREHIKAKEARINTIDNLFAGIPNDVPINKWAEMAQERMLGAKMNASGATPGYGSANAIESFTNQDITRLGKTTKTSVHEVSGPNTGTPGKQPDKASSVSILETKARAYNSKIPNTPLSLQDMHVLRQKLKGAFGQEAPIGLEKTLAVVDGQVAAHFSEEAVAKWEQAKTSYSKHLGDAANNFITEKSDVGSNVNNTISAYSPEYTPSTTSKYAKAGRGTQQFQKDIAARPEELTKLERQWEAAIQHTVELNGGVPPPGTETAMENIKFIRDIKDSALLEPSTMVPPQERAAAAIEAPLSAVSNPALREEGRRLEQLITATTPALDTRGVGSVGEALAHNRRVAEQGMSIGRAIGSVVLPRAIEHPAYIGANMARQSAAVNDPVLAGALADRSGGMLVKPELNPNDWQIAEAMAGGKPLPPTSDTTTAKLSIGGSQIPLISNAMMKDSTGGVTSTEAGVATKHLADGSTIIYGQNEQGEWIPTQQISAEELAQYMKQQAQTITSTGAQ